MVNKLCHLSAKNKRAMFGWICILIPIVGYIIFHVFPIAISFVLQFCSMDYYDLSTMEWNNFANFKKAYTDERLWKAFGNTLFFCCAQFVSLAIALVTSSALHSKYKGTKFFEVVFYIPHICSMVALSVMWKWMFNVDHGVINSFLVELFGEAARINWFGEEWAYRWAIFIVLVWYNPGYGIIMYKSAFTTINDTIYEAAKIDGANTLQRFFKITVPCLKSMTFYLFMLGIIAGMQTFDIAKLFAGAQHQGYAGPHNSGLTLSFLVYKQAFDTCDMGTAAVTSWFLFIITLLMSVISFKVRSRGGDN